MADYHGKVHEIGVWNSGYRPTKFRVMTEGAHPTHLWLYDIDGSVIASAGTFEQNYNSGDIVDIPPFTKDIGYLEIWGFDPNFIGFYITDIQFFPAP